MMVRQTTTTILSLQLILLLLSRHVASVSLSQFQQIQGFSTSCENVWLEDIPGCSTQDFTKPNSCSRNCIAGVNIINAEVLVACVDARVSRNTLLGEFLAGFGVAALCGSSGSTGSTGSGGTSESTTIADSTTATTTAVKTTATSTSLTSVQSTTTTAVQDTTTQPSVLSTTSSATTSTTSSIATSTTSTSVTELTLSFSGTTTTSPTSSVSTTTSAKTSSTSSSNTEGKGFGGVGDAFDILGGESAGSRLEYMSFEVMSLMSVLIIAVARAIW